MTKPKPLKGNVIWSDVYKDGRKEYPDCVTVGALRSAIKWLKIKIGTNEIAKKEGFIGVMDVDDIQNLIDQAFEEVIKNEPTRTIKRKNT